MAANWVIVQEMIRAWVVQQLEGWTLEYCVPTKANQQEYEVNFQMNNLWLRLQFTVEEIEIMGIHSFTVYAQLKRQTVRRAALFTICQQNIDQWLRDGVNYCTQCLATLLSQSILIALDKTEVAA